MNIIKFKDILATIDENHGAEEVTLFNEYFRGKYCWWTRCIYVHLFDEYTQNEIIDIEQTGTDSKVGTHIIMSADWTNYIDMTATEYANNITRWSGANKRIIDNNIILDDLRAYRTRVAQWLLGVVIDEDFDIDTAAEKNAVLLEYAGSDYCKLKEMLNYYKNEMYNTTIGSLLTFTGPNTYTQNAPISYGCGCSASSLAIDTTTITATNPIAIYRRNVYNYMVQVFSDVNFWKLFEEDGVLQNLKEYTQGVIDVNLPLTPAPAALEYADCSSLLTDTNVQLTTILSNLVLAINYIQTDKDIEYRNFIYQSFFMWAAKLYEYMRWNAPVVNTDIACD